MNEGVEQLTINLDNLDVNDKEYTMDKLYIFQNTSNKIKIDRKEKIQRAQNSKSKNIFKGKKLVFTGKMSIRRKEIIEVAKKYGANTTSIVSRYTDILVVGGRAGKKLCKAKELKMAILLEDEFWDIINEGKEIEDYLFITLDEEIG